MSLTSLPFLLLTACAVLLYWLAPKKRRWLLLLAASWTFYLFCGWRAAAWLLLTTVTAYAAGRLLAALCERQKAADKAEKAALTRRKRLVLALTLVLNFGGLFLAKYWSHTAALLGSLFGAKLPAFSLLLPLGLSFYMFQSMGYVIDCYRGRGAERSFLRFALFVSFFPQLVQGPISRFGALGGELFRERDFCADDLKYGIERMLWGYFKKLVLADRAAVAVGTIFGAPEQYGGLFTAFGVLLYCVQLYCDFSGGIDVSIGVAQLFGVTLAENFRRPIFARSLSEYWRRWHVTLGTWMRDYVFYPLTLSRAFVKLGQRTRRRIGGMAGKVVPTSLATLIVYLVIGVWHGAEAKYFAFGLYNGVLMTLALLLAGRFRAVKTRLGVGEQGWYRAFELLRTMLIVFVGRYLTRAAGLQAALAALWKTVRHPCLYQLADGTFSRLGLAGRDFAVLGVGTALLLLVEWRQEKGVEVRKTLEKQRPFVQWLAILAPLLVLLFFGILRDPAIQAEFIYRQF